MADSDQPPGEARGRSPDYSLAVISLVLGFFAMLPSGYGLFFSLPAIIVGHFARYRAKNFPERFNGRNVALIALVLGYVTTLFWLSVPELTDCRADARSIKCYSNLRQIGLGAKLWATNHNERFPSDFIEFKDELGTPRLLCCPRDKSRTPATNWNMLTPDSVSYVIVSPGTTNRDPSTVFARCLIHGFELMADGRVEQEPTPPAAVRSWLTSPPPSSRR